ncbi:MAG: response regulator transcription factor [Treponema sp.]|jgi:DNA-binding NarL/FixJ family response regulator|nr:response regulator transcription factor [Treponema sp.]
MIIVMQMEQDLNRIREVVDSCEDLTVIGTGADSYAAIRLTETEQPDIAIIDYQLDYSGLDIVSLVKRRSPGTAIILISSCSNGKDTLDVLSMGASAYLLRKSDMDVLVSIIHVVQAGGYCISHRLMTQVFQALPKSPQSGKFVRKFFPYEALVWQGLNFSALNRTELRILEFIGQSKSTKEISETLHLKMGTVRNYISALMRKNGVQSRLEMAHFVRNYGQRQLKTERTPQRDSRPASTTGRAEKFLPLLEARLNLEG